MSTFPGKIVLPTGFEDNGKTEVRDLFGATLRFNRESKWMKISAESAIEKVLKKYHMDSCR